MIGEARASVTRRFSGIGKKDVSTGKKTLILIGFCTAQLLDVTTTHIGLSQGRQELNGVAAWIIQNNGELAVYALKLSLVAGLVAFLLLFGRRRAGIWNAYLIAASTTTFGQFLTPVFFYVVIAAYMAFVLASAWQFSRRPEPGRVMRAINLTLD